MYKVVIFGNYICIYSMKWWFLVFLLFCFLCCSILYTYRVCLTSYCSIFYLFLVVQFSFKIYIFWLIIIVEVEVHNNSIDLEWNSIGNYNPCCVHSNITLIWTWKIIGHTTNLPIPWDCDCDFFKQYCMWLYTYLYDIFSV